MKKPVLLAALVLVIASALISVAGGALGAAFGLGFLGSPIPEISVPGEKIVDIGGYELINSSILLWAAIVIIITISFLGTRNMKMVPTGFQNFMEFMVESFNGLVESVGGPSARRFLPLVMTIFLTVLISNWLGILPGVGTIGRIETAEELIEEELEVAEEVVLDKRIEKLIEADEALTHSQAEALVDTHSAEFELAAYREALAEIGDDNLTVFDGSGNFNYIPFGRGDDTKTPLENLVFGISDDLPAEEQLEKIKAGIARHIVVAPPLDDDGEPQPELVGKDTGILIPYLRGPNTDLNTTLAIALVAMFTIQWWGVRTLGFRGYGGKFINLKNGPIHFAVGLLEIVSEVSRIISFTFRLFGNMFAGEVLLVVMAFLFPLIGIIPFLGLELFVGAIQAFIFAMLTLVFAVVATSAHGAEEH